MTDIVTSARRRIRETKEVNSSRSCPLEERTRLFGTVVVEEEGRLRRPYSTTSPIRSTRKSTHTIKLHWKKANKWKATYR